MDYTNFKTNDFINDDFFISWVKHPDEENDAFWKNFIAQNPSLKPSIDKAKLFILAAQPSIIHRATEQQGQKMWTVIKKNTFQHTPFRRVSTRWIWIAAASVAMIFLLAGFYWIKTQNIDNQRLTSISTIENTKNLLTTTNHSSVAEKVKLSDGSIITLAPNSQLQYPETFAKDKRIVYLNGEAFFEVTKNPKKPFLIFTQKLVTKVLGTSFRIKAYPDMAEEKVQVKTGRVSVVSQVDFNVKGTQPYPEESGLVLTPNQEAIYFEKDAKLVKKIAEVPDLLLPIETVQAFSFHNTTLPKVFEALEKAYGIRIVFDEKTFEECTISGNLFDEPLFDKLNLIAKTTGIQYQIIEAQIIISGQGCE